MSLSPNPLSPLDRGSRRGRPLYIPSASGPETGGMTANPIRRICVLKFSKHMRAHKGVEERRRDAVKVNELAVLFHRRACGGGGGGGGRPPTHTKEAGKGAPAGGGSGPLQST